jgi:phosphohistidine phosphatase
MDLYLIRHAHALALGERGITDDEQRPLSEKGEEQAAALGRFFKARGMAFDRIVSSPLVRARQTAEIMLKASGTDMEITLTDSLTPNARCKKLARYLMKTGGEKVALVGHLPHMADFTAWIIGGKKAQIEFAKAGVALVSSGDSPVKGNGVLHWLLTPDWFQ